MTPFSRAIRELFVRFHESELLKALESSHQQLVDRRVEVVEFGDPLTLTPTKKAAANCKLLQQTLLHRAERLVVSSGTALFEHNVYGLALMVRGHYEATAVLGYFCNRLESLAARNIGFEDFAQSVADALIGAKHGQFTKARPPLNILTCIEKADKYLDRHLLQEKLGVLQDGYDWLSEFAHPNFLSNFSAYRLDKLSHRMILRHAREAQKEDFELLNYLKMSSRLFIWLFDNFAQRSPDGGLAD